MSLWNLVFFRRNEREKLENYLSTKYSGEAFAVYKGRDAIEFVLRVLLQPGDSVLTQAFSCYAVEEGIVRAGMNPVYVDIKQGDTNLSVQTLERAFKKNPEAKAVLVQHSLGIPAQSKAIATWCKKNKLLFIEDLAQGIGGSSEDGAQLGKYADAIIHSFGRDKIIDATAGGAAIFKTLTKQQQATAQQMYLPELPYSIVLSDLLYPLVTYLIRRTHHLGIGKLLFVICKRIGLLGSPILSKTVVMKRLHPAYAALALYQLRNLEKQIQHRKKIAQIYFDSFEGNSSSLVLSSQEKILHSSNLRFSFVTDNPTRVIDHLKHYGVYIPDRWYRSAVDCGSFLCESVYTAGSCPNAETLAKSVINLPTHREVSEVTAQKICRLLHELL